MTILEEKVVALLIHLSSVGCREVVRGVLHHLRSRSSPMARLAVATRVTCKLQHTHHDDPWGKSGRAVASLVIRPLLRQGSCNCSRLILISARGNNAHLIQNLLPDLMRAATFGSGGGYVKNAGGRAGGLTSECR